MNNTVRRMLGGDGEGSPVIGDQPDLATSTIDQLPRSMVVRRLRLLGGLPSTVNMFDIDTLIRLANETIELTGINVPNVNARSTLMP